MCWFVVNMLHVPCVGCTGGAGLAYPAGAYEFTSFVFGRIRVAQSLVFCVMFFRSLFAFCFLFFWQSVDYPSLIYGCLLPLWYLHIFLVSSHFLGIFIFVLFDSIWQTYLSKSSIFIDELEVSLLVSQQLLYSFYIYISVCDLTFISCVFVLCMVYFLSYICNSILGWSVWGSGPTYLSC